MKIFLRGKRNTKKKTRRRIHRQLRRTFLIMSFLILMAVALGWSLPRLEFFALNKIEVIGETKTISSAQVKKLSQVKLGTNLLSIKLSEVQAKVARHDYFKTVTVERKLPQTLVIRVEEHAPAFVLHTGRLYYIAEDGRIYKDITDGKESRDFPVLSGMDETMILKEPQKLKAMAQQAARLKKVYLLTLFSKEYGLSEIHYDKISGFTLYPEKQKFSIQFGFKEFKSKTQKLTQVWKKLKESKTKLSSIDLNYPGRVLLKQ